MTAGPIFLLGCAWRCGSTLLQRYVNSTGEAFIWGENLGLATRIAQLFDFNREWDGLIKEQRRWTAEHGHNAWIANLNPETPAAPADIVRLLLTMYYEKPTREAGLSRWGFKEVRHDAADVRMLLTAFPEARVVFLVRHLTDVLASNLANHWIDTLGGAQGVAEQWVRSCRSISALHDPRVLTLRYEDLVGRPDETTARLSVHLDIPADKFSREVLETRVRGGGPEPVPPDVLAAAGLGHLTVMADSTIAALY